VNLVLERNIYENKCGIWKFVGYVITYNYKGVFSLRIWPLGGENARKGV
jgi:hypothetical protein